MSAVDTGDCQRERESVCVCVCSCVYVCGFQWIFTTALAENVLDVRTVEQSHCVVISSSVLEVKLKDYKPETGHLHFSNNVGSTEWKGPR